MLYVAPQIGGIIKAFQAEVDALTRREGFAETAFLDLYRSLDEAPDPVAPMKAAAAEINRLSVAAAEAESLKRQVEDYQVEFTSLKNQEQAVKRLTQQLREAEERIETSASEAAERREHEWAELQQQLLLQLQQHEAQAAAQLHRALEEGRVAARAQQAAQDQLLDMRTAYEEAQVPARVGGPSGRRKREGTKDLEMGCVMMRSHWRPTKSPSVRDGVWMVCGLGREEAEMRVWEEEEESYGQDVRRLCIVGLALCSIP